MNNAHFRSLLGSDTTPRDSSQEAPSSSSSRAVLGSRKSGHTPTNAAFAQTLRQRTNLFKPTTKKFKTSAPRGTKVAAGFVDRAKERAKAAAAAEDEGDERAKRIAALEKQYKEKEITRAEFEAQREVIAGGDISATHLIKGLDRALLERVRNGEDVMGSGNGLPRTAEDEEVDEELDRIESGEVRQVETQKSVKQGVLSSEATRLTAGRKRTRDEIMAELKAQRKGGKTAIEKPKEAELDGRWKRISEQQRSRIEIDKKGREVLVIVDEDGIVKKKVRRAAPQVLEQKEEQIIGRSMPGEILGADITVPKQSEAPAAINPARDSDDDIFEGVGAEYDPLGDEGDDIESGTSDDEDTPRAHPVPAQRPHSLQYDETAAAPSRRNYFNDVQTEQETQEDRVTGVEAVIAKAARLASTRQDNDTHSGDAAPEDPEAAARRAKYAKMLDNRDRDMDDMDVGFGGSRFEDGEDGDDSAKGIKLSEWSDDKAKHDGDKTRKRRPKGETGRRAMP